MPQSYASAKPHNVISGAFTPAGPPLPRALDHNGIEDHFLDEASTILYVHRGRWRELQGMD